MPTSKKRATAKRPSYASTSQRSTTTFQRVVVRLILVCVGLSILAAALHGAA